MINTIMCLKKIILCIILLGTTRFYAQQLVSSNTSIRTCVNERQCSILSNVSYLFYDEAKNSFYLKVYFSEIEAGDTLNGWLRDLEDTVFYFKGNFPKENFPDPNNFHSKTFTINGHSFVNNIWHAQKVELNFFISESNILNPSVGDNESGSGTIYDRYLVNFGLSFLPSQYNMHRGRFSLQNPIFIAVTSGRINLLKPGMEHLVSPVYDRD